MWPYSFIQLDFSQNYVFTLGQYLWFSVILAALVLTLSSLKNFSPSPWFSLNRHYPTGFVPLTLAGVLHGRDDVWDLLLKICTDITVILSTPKYFWALVPCQPWTHCKAENRALGEVAQAQGAWTVYKCSVGLFFSRLLLSKLPGAFPYSSAALPRMVEHWGGRYTVSARHS